MTKKKLETILNFEKKIKQMKKDLEYWQAKLVEEKKIQQNFLKPHEIEIIRLCTEHGYSTRKIATLLGRARSTVHSHAQKMEKQETDVGEKFFLKRSLSGGFNKKEGPDRGKISDLFEQKFNRKIDWSKLEDRTAYNRIYKEIKTGIKQKERKPYSHEHSHKKRVDETDEERAERIRICHMNGKTTAGTPLMNLWEHDGEKQCPYCFPENSHFEITTVKEGKNKGYTEYDMHLRGRNMSAKQFALSHPKKKGFHYKEDDEEKPVITGSGVYDEKGNDIGLANPENHQTEEVKLSSDDQRYVNKIEERIKRQKTEIANIKKKRGTKK